MVLERSRLFDRQYVCQFLTTVMHVYALKRSLTRSPLPTLHPQLICQRPSSFTPRLPTQLVQTFFTFATHQGLSDKSTPSFLRPPALTTTSAQIMPSATSEAANDPEQPWYAAYPEANSRPTPISCSEVLDLLKKANDGTRLVLVDLRRTDYEVRQR